MGRKKKIQPGDKWDYSHADDPYISIVKPKIENITSKEKVTELKHLYDVYRPKFRIHIKTLQAAAKKKEDLKLYTLYLNLHSLYKQKVFLNYKERLFELKYYTGFSVTLLKKYIPKLIKIGACSSKDGKHLHIHSSLKFMSYYGIDKIYKEHPEQKVQYYTSKFIFRKRTKHLTEHELESIILEIIRRQKRRSFIYKIYGGREGVTQNVREKYIEQVKLKITNKCATDPTADCYLHLCLDDVKNLFGLKTKQGASQRLQTLVKKKLIKSKPIYKTLGLSYPGEIIEKGFVKGKWAIEQKPNEITFVNPILNPSWWDDIITSYFKTEEKNKIINRKAKNNKVNVIDCLFNRIKTYLNQPCKYSKKKFRAMYIDKKTGEVIHESIYFIFKDLTSKGNNMIKEYVSGFKQINEKFIVIKEQLEIIPGEELTNHSRLVVPGRNKTK